MLVKLCGLRRAAEVRRAAELGAWACGFVFHRPSPRCVTPEAAAALGREAGSLLRVGVFVEQDLDQIRRVAEAAGVDGVQLHRAWTGWEVARLRQEGLTVIGLLRPQWLEGVAGLGEGERPHYFLFEPPAGGLGGTGRRRDWRGWAQRLAHRPLPRPFLVAGGLDEASLKDAVEAMAPDGVDVSSGIERRPGVKDLERMGAFLERVGEIHAARHHRERRA